MLSMLLFTATFLLAAPLLGQAYMSNGLLGNRNRVVGNNKRYSINKVTALMLASNSAAALPGSVVALVTPMNNDNSIDYPKLEQLLQWHVKEGTDGAVVLGTTGEASTISMDERTQIIKTAVKTVNKAFPIIIGTGCVEASKTINLCKHALECGADASLIITPYYVKPPQRALVDHFRSIADAVPDLPMILYNCPGRTGVDMKPETIAQIASHKSIIGVKEASGEVERVKMIRSLCGEDFLLYSGDDETGCDFVKSGGDGVISVTSNVAPASMHKMMAAARGGDSATADAINEYLMTLHQRLFLEANPIPAKKALELMGRIGSGIRPPLCTLDPALVPSLREALVLGKCMRP